jgi:hypothetical protein
MDTGNDNAVRGIPGQRNQARSSAATESEKSHGLNTEETRI